MAEQCRFGYNMVQRDPYGHLELHIVTAQGKSLPVVYDPRPFKEEKYSLSPKPLGVIVTVLPRGAMTLTKVRKEEW